MDRKNFWYKQLVTEAQMDAAFDDVEYAINRAVSEWVLYGIISGGTVTAQMVPDDTVNIAGPFYGYSPQGERLHSAASSSLLDCSIDRDGVATAPAMGKERYIIVLAGFDRTPSDPHLDGHGLTVYWQLSEAVVWEVVQGAEAGPGAAVPPAIPSDRLCLAVVKLDNPAGVVEIHNADIFAEVGSVKRSDWLYYASSGYVTSAQQFGTPKAAVTALFDRFANLTALQASKSDPGDWAIGLGWETPHGTTVSSVIDAMMASLRATNSGTGTSGADRIGVEPLGPFADGSTVAAGSLGSNLASIMAVIGGSGGEQLLGTAAWASGGAYNMTGGTLRTQLREVVANLNDHVANGGGNHNAGAITFTPVAAWYGAAKALAAVNVQAAVNEVVSDLVTVTNAALNGANYVGAFGQAGTPTALVTGSIYSQLGTLLAAVNDRVSMSAGAEQEMVTGIKPTVSGASGLGTALLPWGTCYFDNLYLADDGILAPRTGDTIRTTFHADPFADNTYDMGQPVKGWRNIYFTTDVLATAELTRYRVFHPWSAQIQTDETHTVPEPWARTYDGASTACQKCLDASYCIHVPLSPELKDGETLDSLELCVDRNGGTVTMKLYRQHEWNTTPTLIDTTTIAAGAGKQTNSWIVNSTVNNDHLWYVEITTDTVGTLYYGCRARVDFNSIVR